MIAYISIQQLIFSFELLDLLLKIVDYQIALLLELVELLGQLLALFGLLLVESLIVRHFYKKNSIDNLFKK